MALAVEGAAVAVLVPLVHERQCGDGPEAVPVQAQTVHASLCPSCLLVEAPLGFLEGVIVSFEGDRRIQCCSLIEGMTSIL